MAGVRAAETLEQALKQSMSIKRRRNVSVECAVSAFHSEVKLGPLCVYMLSPHNVPEKCYSV